MNDDNDNITPPGYTFYDPFNNRDYFNNSNVESLFSLMDMDEDYKIIIKDDHDSYVVLGGYADKGSGADASYIQYYMNKGTYTPFTIIYKDYYVDSATCLEQYKELFESITSDFGSPESILYIDGNSEESSSLSEISQNITSLSNMSGYYYINWPTENILYILVVQYSPNDNAYMLDMAMVPQNR